MPLLSLLFSNTLSENLSSTIAFVLHAVVLFVLGVFLNIPGPSLKVILLNVNKPQFRGTTTAISEFFNNLGRIAGPVIFTYLERSKTRIDSTLTISSFFYIASAFAFMLHFTIEKDEENVNEYIHNFKENCQEDSPCGVFEVPKQQNSGKEYRDLESQQSDVDHGIIENVPLLHA